MNITSRSVVLAILFFLASPIAMSCSCLLTDTEESRFHQATHIFSARITGANEVRDSKGPRVEASFSVTEVFKGHPDNLTGLWSHIPFGKGSSSCAITFSVGQHYIFLVSDEGLVDYCSGSKRYNPALEKSVVEALRDISRAKTP